MTIVPQQDPAHFRHVIDSVFALKKYQWVTPQDPFAGVRRWWHAVGVWLKNLANTHPGLFYLLAAALVIILVAILVHAGYILVQTVRAGKENPLAIKPSLLRSEAWYREQADRLAREGHLVEAMQAEFLALVLALDALRVLRFHPSKTPAEYVHETTLLGGAREEFRNLVRSLYGYAFARWPLDGATFREWRDHAAVGRYAPPR